MNEQGSRPGDISRPASCRSITPAATPTNLDIAAVFAPKRPRRTQLLRRAQQAPRPTLPALRPHAPAGGPAARGSGGASCSKLPSKRPRIDPAHRQRRPSPDQRPLRLLPGRPLVATLHRLPRRRSTASYAESAAATAGGVFDPASRPFRVVRVTHALRRDAGRHQPHAGHPARRRHPHRLPGDGGPLLRREIHRHQAAQPPPRRERRSRPRRSGPAGRHPHQRRIRGPGRLVQQNARAPRRDARRAARRQRRARPQSR